MATTWNSLNDEERSDLIGQVVTVTYKSNPLSHETRTRTGEYIGSRGECLTFLGVEGRFTAKPWPIENIEVV